MINMSRDGATRLINFKALIPLFELFLICPRNFISVSSGFASATIYDRVKQLTPRALTNQIKTCCVFNQSEEKSWLSVSGFPALGTGCMLSRAWRRLNCFTSISDCLLVIFEIAVIGQMCLIDWSIDHLGFVLQQPIKSVPATSSWCFDC